MAEIQKINVGAKPDDGTGTPCAMRSLRQTATLKP